MLDVRVPVGGTAERLRPDNIGRYRLAILDPEGIKARLENTSLHNFLAVVEMAVARLGARVSDIGYWPGGSSEQGR